MVEVNMWTEDDEFKLTEMLELLNEAIHLHRDAMEVLIDTRVSCNRDLAKHKSIQVMGKYGNYAVGFLGMLNGLLGIDANKFGPITAYYDEEGKLTKFAMTDTKNITKQLESQKEKKK